MPSIQKYLPHPSSCLYLQCGFRLIAQSFFWINSASSPSPPYSLVNQYHQANYLQYHQYLLLCMYVQIIHLLLQHMSLFEIERLTRQNKKLTDTIRQQARIITTLQNNCQSHNTSTHKLNKQKQHLHTQIKQLKRRIQQQKYEREEIQSRYYSVLKKMEEQIDDRKRKYQKLQSKIQPLLDHDTIRLKILNQVESVHTMEIAQFKRKIELLKDQLLKYKRELEIARHQLQTQKMEHVEQLRKVRMRAEQSSNRDHFNSMTYEVCSELENRLRLSYEQARKQSEYYKDKYFRSERKNQQKMAAMERELQLLKERHMITAGGNSH